MTLSICCIARCEAIWHACGGLCEATQQRGILAAQQRLAHINNRRRGLEVSDTVLLRETELRNRIVFVQGSISDALS